jgi:hypothetical protein
MSTERNKFEMPLTQAAIEAGHGKFPYVVIRLTAANYMQLPIYFVQERMPGKNGLQIQSSEDSIEKDYRHLIQAVANYKNVTEQKNQTSHQMCLVISPNMAYYFGENGIRFSPSIPYGGSLFNTDRKMIAMNERHYC